VFLGFGFVSASRILPVYWGALRFLIKLLFTYQKKKRLTFFFPLNYVDTLFHEAVHYS
jgi:hypothetical protein